MSLTLYMLKLRRRLRLTGNKIPNYFAFYHKQWQQAVAISTAAKLTIGSRSTTDSNFSKFWCFDYQLSSVPRATPADILSRLPLSVIHNIDHSFETNNSLVTTIRNTTSIHDQLSSRQQHLLILTIKRTYTTAVHDGLPLMTRSALWQPNYVWFSNCHFAINTLKSFQCTSNHPLGIIKITWYSQPFSLVV